MTALTPVTPQCPVPTYQALARQVAEMEQALELIRRRDTAAAALAERRVRVDLGDLAPADVIALVCDRRRVSVAEIRSGRRTRRVSYARHEIFYLMAIQARVDGSARWSLPQIGARVAGPNRPPFDHTSVLHGATGHAERLRAAAAGEAPSAVVRRARPPLTARKRAAAPVVVCALPTDEPCPGCGAPGGQPCFDGARRG